MGRNKMDKEKRTIQIAVKVTESMRERLLEIGTERDWTLSHTAYKLLELAFSVYDREGLHSTSLRKTA